MFLSVISLGMKDSLGPLKALVVASVINGIGDIVLCIFLGYGIAGAAWATAASQVCSVPLSFKLSFIILHLCLLLCFSQLLDFFFSRLLQPTL